ncbi:MAG TPA: carbohydrate kinase family protein, partial [Solirubrobacterales bacterium]|nr:carbohydrate kinase family protein [Solirubrobacterales bacterium]
MKSPKVICLGVHLLDVLVQPSRQPKPAVGWQLLDDLRITAAGTAAGPAVDLAKLGAESISMGVIGGDFEGNVVADLMADHGCDVSRLVRAEGAGTHVSLLFIDENGERNPVMIRPTTARSLTMADIDLDTVAAADVLHIGGADQLGDFLGEPLVELIRFAREHDTVVTVDVLGAGTDEMREALAPALREAQFFFPNEGQVAGMTGTEDPGEGAARLRELLGVETVVGTLGADGSLIVGAAGATAVPAFEIDLVDT